MNLRIKTSVAAAVFALGMAAPAFAAPLFPDVPENHWARDAVATLAAKGIVEGYPDGTFKGDRSATRWEVAMVVARLLAKMEQEHATFATKAELAELQKLVDALRSELDALGVRVTKLEDDVQKLDMRVSELERITFYGSIDARATFQSFKNSNDGQHSNDVNGPSDAAYLSYDDAVGTLAGASLQSHYIGGAMPVMDMTSGTPLTNGTGLTMKAILGLRVRVTDDIDAGAEFAAYTSAGDSVVDAFWGVTAPYSCNQFTGNYASPENAAPYTRMVLDNFWVMHNPSGTKLTVGSFSDDMVDDILFAGQKNLGYFGNEYLDNFGFNLNGAHSFGDTGVLRWEVMGSRISDGNVDGVVATINGVPFELGSYNTDILAADLGFEFRGGQVKVNFMRAANEANGGDSLRVGGLYGANMNYMGNNANGIASLQWVNPAGYYVANLVDAGGLATQTTDGRPIPGWGTTDGAGNYVAADAGHGLIGPQSEIGWGASVDYKWDIGESGTEIYVAGEYGHTQYKSNKNSDYSSDGNAYRAEVGANLLDGDLDVSLAYVNVDPNYDPFVNMNPIYNGSRIQSWQLPGLNYYSDMWSLHDTETYPQNRKGLVFNGQWRFLERHGLVWAKAQFLDQTETSLYDTRVLAAADGPMNNVMGFAPGFMDPVFYGYAATEVYGNIYGAAGDNFDDDLNPLEDQRGKQTNWGLGVSYKWDNPRLKLDLGYENNAFKRDSDLGAIDRWEAASQNKVDLKTDSFHAGLGWEANEKWNVRLGVDVAQLRGHWDPAGNYNTYAGLWQDAGFKNYDLVQTVPFIGFDYDMSANTQWNMDFRYYDTVDKIDATTFAGDTTGSGYTAHPFSWHGWQINTQFKLKF